MSDVGSTEDEVGPYRFLRVVGSGGMGVVYEAWDQRLDRRVAIKMLHPHVLTDSTVSERLLREARLAARLEHPNIVHIYRVETLQNQIAIEMQYIEGTALNVLMRSGPMAPSQGAEILRQLLQALAVCHSHGVIHCDLKPANVMVTHEGRAILTDFSIARALYAADGTFSPAPPSGPLWGTPRYSPPEAWHGGPVSPQWDLYAAGVMFYEVLTGSPPFHGESPPALMHAVLYADPPPIGTLVPGLSTGLADLVSDLMARVPADRPPNAEAALARLIGVVEVTDNSAVTAPILPTVPPAAPVSTTRRRLLNNWRLGVLVVSSGMVVAVMAALASFNSRRPAITSPPAISPTYGIAAPRESLANPGDLAVVEGLVFCAVTDSARGRELWATWAPDVALHPVADIAPGAESSHPHRITQRPLSGFVFAATTPETGEELWYGDHSGGGDVTVRMIKDIIPGSMGSEPLPVAAHGPQVLFYATTLQAGRELWCTNGRDGQTAMVADLLPGPMNSMPMTTRVHQAGASVYFVAMNDGVRGNVLFRYDFESNTVRELCDVAEDTGYMTKLDDTLLFANATEAYGYELWAWDEARSQLAPVADLWPGPQSSSPNELYQWGEHVLFHARTADTGLELWISDGTAAGTMLIADINPGPGDSDPFGFTAVGDYVFFRAKNADGRELWVTDGTGQGTYRVADTMPGAYSGEPYNLVGLGDTLYFSAKDPEHGEELWRARMDGGSWTAHLLIDIVPGPASSEPHALQWLRDDVGFLLAAVPEYGKTLCTLRLTDGKFQITPHHLTAALKDKTSEP